MPPVTANRENPVPLLHLAHRLLFAAGFAVLALPMPALARAVDSPGVCEEAAGRAARQSGVPLDVLRSIALVETGRTQGGDLRPWPWAVNVGGEGHWFATRHEAEGFAAETLRMGQQSFDIGCFQINYRWHGAAFGSIGAMFDPEANALYAARFLQQLHEQSGDWSMAAGAYHSATPDLATAYRARFDTVYAGLAGAPLELAGANGFPLLQPGSVGTPGSVVPVSLGGGRPLIGY